MPTSGGALTHPHFTAGVETRLRAELRRVATAMLVDAGFTRYRPLAMETMVNCAEALVNSLIEQAHRFAHHAGRPHHVTLKDVWMAARWQRVLDLDRFVEYCQLPKEKRPTLPAPIDYDQVEAEALRNQQTSRPCWPNAEKPEWLEEYITYPAPPKGFEHLRVGGGGGASADSAAASAAVLEPSSAGQQEPTPAQVPGLLLEKADVRRPGGSADSYESHEYLSGLVRLDAQSGRPLWNEPLLVKARHARPRNMPAPPPTIGGVIVAPPSAVPSKYSEHRQVAAAAPVVEVSNLADDVVSVESGPQSVGSVAESIESDDSSRRRSKRIRTRADQGLVAKWSWLARR